MLNDEKHSKRDADKHALTVLKVVLLNALESYEVLNTNENFRKLEDAQHNYMNFLDEHGLTPKLAQELCTENSCRANVCFINCPRGSQPLLPSIIRSGVAHRH